jgi:hypothetical protein
MMLTHWKHSEIIHTLRNNTPPIDNGEHKSISILNRLGINYPPENWSKAGIECIKHFLDSINILINVVKKSTIAATNMNLKMEGNSYLMPADPIKFHLYYRSTILEFIE